MKFLARSMGLLLVAAGFVGLVIDGTRSMVNSAISFASLGGVVNLLLPGGMPGLQNRLAQPAYPWVWDPLFTNLLQAPASLSGFLLGALLLWLGQKPMETIGYLTER